jgi:hypothetical protein
MCSFALDDLALIPTLLGRDGLRRAYMLVAVDRPGLSIETWIKEASWLTARRDQPLAICDPIPTVGMVGLCAPVGSVFAVFAYANQGATGQGILTIKGPSWVAPMGRTSVVKCLSATVKGLQSHFDCRCTIRRAW